MIVSIVSCFFGRALVARVPVGVSQQDQTVSVVLTEYLAYQSKPFPEVIGQDEAQFLMYNTESTFPETAYATKKMTLKYRCVRSPADLSCGS